jgi:hypothetical protein
MSIGRKYRSAWRQLALKPYNCKDIKGKLVKPIESSAKEMMGMVGFVYILHKNS